MIHSEYYLLFKRNVMIFLLFMRNFDTHMAKIKLVFAIVAFYSKDEVNLNYLNLVIREINGVV